MVDLGLFSKLKKINAVNMYLLEQNSAARRSSTLDEVRVATTVTATFSPGTREVSVVDVPGVFTVCTAWSEGWKVETRFVTGLSLVSETSRLNCVVWTFDWARASETKFIRSYYVSLLQQNLALKYLLYFVTWGASWAACEEFQSYQKLQFSIDALWKMIGGIFWFRSHSV